MANDSPLMLGSWPNAILHFDGDAFFASCEQSIHPELKGRPVVTGQERNIVASMSYEAKALGIKRAVPLWEARKMCPGLVVLPSDYETYSLISKRMFSIIRRFTPTVEESSIDEGFAELDGLRRLYRTGYPEIALQIQSTIEKELDISISVGLSINKTLAKLASRFKKPKGFTAVRGRDVHRFLAQIPAAEVCGIGPNTTALLRKRGVVTALDYAQKPGPWIHQLLGKTGIELWRELCGEAVYAINTQEKSTYESISKTKTFTPPSENFNFIQAQLFRNTESAYIKLRRYRLQAKRLIVYLRMQDFRSAGLVGDLTRPTNCPMEAFPLIEQLFRKIYRQDCLYRSTGIVLAELSAETRVQFELFESPVRMQSIRRLSQCIDEINAVYGKHTVFSATGLFLKPKRGPNLHGRHALAGRKTDLLPGETFRQRLGIPVWQIKI